MKYQHRFRASALQLLSLGVFLLFSAVATAQCGANMCAPVVSGVTGQPNAIVVHWLPGGGTPPQRVALMKGGTAGKGFNDGAQLAAATETSPLGQYASYNLPVNNLPANTSFPLGSLHVIGYWATESITSAGFGGATQNNPPASNAPGFTQTSYDSYGRFNLAWSAGAAYGDYNIRWSSGSTLAANASQQQVSGTSFTYRPSSQGPYTFIVEGCNKTPLFGNSTCSSWSQPVTLYAAPLPAPQTKPFYPVHQTAGDCELNATSVVFRSNGTGTFNAQVKTNKTHTGDVWHATITGKNAAGQTLLSLPTFDSMRMDDDHGYYPWSFMFEFDPTQFMQLASIQMHNGC